MKNIKISILAMLFAFPLITDAQTLHYSWAKDLGPTAQLIYSNGILEADDSLISMTTTEQGYGIARKVSKDGREVLWEFTLDYDGYFTSEVEYGGYHYLSSLDCSEFAPSAPATYGYYGLGCINRVYKLDKNGRVVNQAMLYENDTDVYHNTLYRYDGNFYLIDYDYIGDVENKRTDDYYGIRMLYTLDDNLNVKNRESYWNIPEEEAERITFLNDFHYENLWEELSLDIGHEILISNQKSNDDSTFAVGEVYNDDKTQAILLKVDNETEKLIWYKTLDEEDTHYFDISFINEKYFAVVMYSDSAIIGEHRHPDTVKSYIYVFDLDGNIVEKYDLADDFNKEKIDVTFITTTQDSLVGQAYWYEGDSNDIKQLLFSYKIEFEINSNVIGDGTVTVEDGAVSGESVQLTLTPNEGNKVDQVEIVDAAGNKIEYKDGQFIMPSSAVTINVKFAPVEAELEPDDNPNNNTNNDNNSNGTVENPKTGISTGGTLIIIGLLSIVGYNLIRKKVFKQI